ncbi:cytochrome c oxidase assembly protein [Erythrobacter arachoides]|uniref:Cytochrome c oxidase assembly protein n=1 Tax=Aurantiacibacter arachoides TaxID=1850444 RepID=A0A844ZX22_9SPHN|nr:cytochrome c oxidase assembly protein [Aurantiacibacter arachoides]MXO92663.1 cytochrome c oxidase assembly protein [Aurantiacibacter arachoides]
MTTTHAQRWHPYCGEAPGPAHWLAHWNWDWVLLGSLAVLLLFGFKASRATMRSQLAATACMVILFVTPLCALGSALFLARSIHHLALALVLAPLLVGAVGARAFPNVSLGLATVVQTAILWAWHVPASYAQAMSNDLVFWAMQVSITLSAAAWWVSVRRATALGAAAGLLAQMVQMGVLGALLVFAGRALYAPHWLTTTLWGLTALEDQQVAGLVMWVGGGGAYLLLAMAMLWRALGADARPLPASRPA